MQLFYFKSRAQNGNPILEEDELGHCVRTLRKQVGDNLHLIDGVGGLYLGELLSFDKRQAEVRILENLPRQLPSALDLHLVVAPTKNMDRVEWLLEKAIEIGLARFTPLLASHSERKNIRVDRLEKIALAAAKQSLNLQLPQIDEMIDFKSFMQQNVANETNFIAHCYADEPRQFLPLALQNVATTAANTPQKITILIGPEGDFSPKEVAEAIKNGYKAIILGNTRLRTETAGLIAAAMVASQNYTLATK
jgi:16S rRNA (uracil1498-N3)-methyltransferase